MREIRRVPEGAAEAAAGRAARVEASGVGKRFGRKLALDDVSLSVQAGEAVALVGLRRV